MLYLSQLLGMPVENQQHDRAGKIIDVLVPRDQVGHKVVYPAALLVEGEEDQPRRVNLDQIERREGSFLLLVSPEQLTHQAEDAQKQEVYLAREVLDKQVIDVEHKKAIRVNDVCFADDWQLLGIDNSTFGLVRRLAPAWLVGNKNRAITTYIPWEDIELLGTTHPDGEEAEHAGHAGHAGEPVGPGIAALPLQARSPSGQLAELHPADVAQILQQLAPGQSAQLLERLDNQAAADVMQEIDTDQQQLILENIESARAAAILGEMEPDEVADLLARLPDERSQELLRQMKPEESEDVQDLLEYQENSAGGLMTTDFIVLSQTRTAGEALENIRFNIRENDMHPPYVYCVEDEAQDECRLLGIVSIWELLVAPPTQTLLAIMEIDTITVEPEENPRTVAEIMAKYNLLAVPVVNSKGVLEGIVTVDDALDVLLPVERRRKAPRMY